MEAELKRLVMRSPFDVRVPKPKAGRGSDAALSLRPAHRVGGGMPSPHIVANLVGPLCQRRRTARAAVRGSPPRAQRTTTACRRRHRCASRSTSDRPTISRRRRCSCAASCKNAIVEALASRGVPADVDADSPDVVFVVRRAGTPESRRTVVGIDIGGGARHRRGARVAAGGGAAARDDGGAAHHAVAVGRAVRAAGRSDGRRRHDPDRSRWPGGRRRDSAPRDLPFRHLAAFAGLPGETPDLFPGTVPRILALDIDQERIPAMVGNLRAAGLTGPSREDSIVIGQRDVRALTPDDVARMLPLRAAMKPGVFCFNPPYGVRIGGGARRGGVARPLRGHGTCARSLHRLACRLFRRELALRLRLRTFARHDEAGHECRIARRLLPVPALIACDRRFRPYPRTGRNDWHRVELAAELVRLRKRRSGRRTRRRRGILIISAPLRIWGLHSRSAIQASRFRFPVGDPIVIGD